MDNVHHGQLLALMAAIRTLTAALYGKEATEFHRAFLEEISYVERWLDEEGHDPEVQTALREMAAQLVKRAPSQH